MMKRRDGFPIAAHLAALIMLAIAASFVVSVAAVVMMPRRPPDLARSDDVIQAFASGYARAVQNQTPVGDGLRWRIADAAPERSRAPPPARFLSRALAERLNIARDDVRVSARRPPGDYVFRVERHRMHESMQARETIFRAQEGRHGPRSAEPPLFAPPPRGVFLLTGFEIAAKLPDGRWAIMRQDRSAQERAWLARVALAIGLTLLVTALLALYFARRLAIPIQRFAETARSIGVDPAHGAAPVTGPRELRTAARAVNAMQERLRRLVADRTETLAAVAHDMRTPLMRLSLAAENADDATRTRLRKEITEIEALVASFIAFARDDPAQEARVRLDLAALAQAIADDRAESGQNVVMESSERIVITGQALGLKRMIGNLIDNALKHGGNALVSVCVDGDHAIIEVRDDGPGIPADKREDVFKPFVRLNESATRGAGLGLPAARSIARAHGGEVSIADSTRGACVRAVLPL